MDTRIGVLPDKQESALISDMPMVTVVIPVFNEEHSVAECISSVVRTLGKAGVSFEVLAVDDGSRDSSLEKLREIQERYCEYVRIASHVENKGNGAAVRSGIRLAQGEIVVVMDGDGQHQAEDILNLLKWMPPYDMVVGARTSTYQGAWYRNSINRFYNSFASWLTQRKIDDLTSGFRAVRRTVAMHFLHLLPAGFSTPTTLTMTLLKAGYSVKFQPVDVQPRRKGKSKINLWNDGRRFLTIMVRMIMLYNPMRIFAPVMLSMFLLGGVSMLAGILVAKRLVVPGSSVVLFITALLTMLLGAVSSQIADANVRYYGDEQVILYENQHLNTSGQDR